jgi:hypothetical protein
MEREKLSSLDSVQNSTKTKKKYSYTPEKNKELRQAHYDRLHESNNISSLVICRRELIIRLLGKLSNAERHSSPLWKDNCIRTLMDASCKCCGNMNFFES